ncbi:MAG TPA: hypothetical protein HPQ03_11680 [Deltaproteobacteria bacterium]|nr:hypothetical protein [Deltaproteobacteria bacterium]
MEHFPQLKEELINVSQKLTGWISEVNTIPGIFDDTLVEWEKSCQSINRQLSEDIVRVAVVGAIKSGKSTFVNSLFNGDYVMRGAGVITSIVTRIRAGNTLNATLYFKSWDEINSDIRQALVLFPSLNGQLQHDGFDMRVKQKRLTLEDALSGLGSEVLITNDSKNVNGVLLNSYLKGYDRVKDTIGTENVTVEYKNRLFADHRRFVGTDALAVYLRDIELEINTVAFNAHIEIADCQGSDSSNPMHLTMIQDYLIRTHLIVYVISSRTGLRQADIQFLSMINRMGIMDNILFIVNCDLNEHESIPELNRLVGGIKEELSIIKSDPQIYPISALYNLFKELREDLPEKDRKRLSQWEHETQFIEASDQNTALFKDTLLKKLTVEKPALQMKNNLERLGVIVSGMKHWLQLRQEVLSGDAERAKEIEDRIKFHRKKMNSIKSMIKSTLDGAVYKTKEKLRTDIDRFFDLHGGDVMGPVIEEVRSYRISMDEYQETLESSGFTHTLYMVFQEFKQTLDAFMAKTVNPKVVQFIRLQEWKIFNHLGSIAAPYDGMAKDALEEYGRSMQKLGLPLDLDISQEISYPALDAVKAISALSFPQAAASMHYSARIRTEAIMRLGFYSLTKLVKKLLKKPIEQKNEEEIQALKHGVKQMKRETERSIVSHFKDYKENIKFQYLFRLVDAISESIHQTLTERFKGYDTDLSKIVGQMNTDRIDKEEVIESLNRTLEMPDTLNRDISRIRAQLKGSA